MNNEFLRNLKEQTNYTYTENGAIAHKTTMSNVYDMFAFAGAYRSRSEEDCILLFKKAYEENPRLALKCLFYMRDIRGGQGERRFFRTCLKWLAKDYPFVAARVMTFVPVYGRYDDLYSLVGTPVENAMFAFLNDIIKTDLESLKTNENAGISLCAKWLKSENASSPETVALGEKTRKAFKLSHKQYRKTLSILRNRINIVERLMSENRWGEIEFDKIPSKAGFVYRNAFAKHDADRYKDFIESKDSKVKASTLYPYEIVRKVTQKITGYNCYINLTETEREVLNKYWENLPDYLDGKVCKILNVIDTSGSMQSCGYGKVAPIDVAISLGLYCSERIGGDFRNLFISFASRPRFIEVEGIDFVDKVRRIYAQNLCDNTNLEATFELLKNTILNNHIPNEDIPDTLVVISDMEIDSGSYWRSDSRVATEMEAIREDWERHGLVMPHLVYWNVDARNNIILDKYDNSVSYVSGCSPIIFKSILTGKTGQELMLETLESERYKDIE